VRQQAAQTLAKETYRYWQKRPIDTGKRDLQRLAKETYVRQQAAQDL